MRTNFTLRSKLQKRKSSCNLELERIRVLEKTLRTESFSKNGTQRGYRTLTTLRAPRAKRGASAVPLLGRKYVIM